jgi:hypothetical protein
VSRLQRVSRLWLRRLWRLRRLLSVLVVRRLPAGLRLPLAFIDLANHVWFCNTADRDRGQTGIVVRLRMTVERAIIEKR